MINFKGLSVQLFGPFIEKNSGVFSFVKNNLPRADIRVTMKTYMSHVFLYSLIGFVASLAAVQMIFLLATIKIPLLLKISISIFAPVSAAATVFMMGFFYPFQRANSRRKNIESNLPFVLTHMGAVAESGIPPYIIFKLISRFNEYGEISKEMEKIVRNIDTFGIDPLTAVKEVAERTPSEEFKQILLGFVTSTESGGDIKLFLRNAGEQALFDWKNRREKFLQQLSAYAEFYTGILIAAPLFIIALFAVMNMIQPNIGGFDILFLTRISIYLIIPAVNIAFLLFLRGVEVEI